ncbi:hypothetical protein NDA18_005312 [Ustilago nuda]|nr:hypothetical protein NDA18_005312 [Ustilago nuda]
MTEDSNKCRAWEGVHPRWAETKEGHRQGMAREEVVEVGNGALRTTNEWGNNLNVEAERVHLGRWQGDDGVVGGQVDTAHPEDDGRDKAPEEGKGDGKLGAGTPDTVDVLVATQGSVEAAALKASEAEAKVDMVGAEVTELMLGRVEGAACRGHAAQPLKELDAGRQATVVPKCQAQK